MSTQRVLAEGKPATILPADHPFTQWCEAWPSHFDGMVCVELDEQDMPPASWRPLPGAIMFDDGRPHKFRVLAPSCVTAEPADDRGDFWPSRPTVAAPKLPSDHEFYANDFPEGPTTAPGKS